MAKKSARAKAEAKLWEVVKKYIRLRDKDTCQKCGKKVYGQGSDTSHVLCKNRYKGFKFDENNLKVLCMYCHKWWHNCPTESGEWFRRKFPERWEYLEKERLTIKKIRIYELEELKEEYLDKTIGLEMKEDQDVKDENLSAV